MSHYSVLSKRSSYSSLPVRGCTHGWTWCNPLLEELGGIGFIFSFVSVAGRPGHDELVIANSVINHLPGSFWHASGSKSPSSITTAAVACTTISRYLCGPPWRGMQPVSRQLYAVTKIEGKYRFIHRVNLYILYNRERIEEDSSLACEYIFFKYIYNTINL